MSPLPHPHSTLPQNLYSRLVKKTQNSSIHYYSLLVIQHLCPSKLKEIKQAKRQSHLLPFHLNFYQQALNSWLEHMRQPKMHRTLPQSLILWALQIWTTACSPPCSDKWQGRALGCARGGWGTQTAPSNNCSYCYCVSCVITLSLVSNKRSKCWLFQV